MGGLCLPLPMPSRISISSQAAAKETLEWGESEVLSLIESHASVTCKALQSRKDLGATEPQTPTPSPVPPWRSCLSSSPPANELSLGGGQDSPCSPHLVQALNTKYPMDWRIWGYVNGVFIIMVFILGCSLVMSLTGRAPWACMMSC